MDRTEYINGGINTVPGWFARRDALLFDAIDNAQRSAGITGDILEIGVYQGTSAILLGYMRQPNERLIVCDLFDGITESDEDLAERQRYYEPNFGQHKFEAQYRRFHPDLPEIIAQPSSSLHARLTGKTFRCIHIDGSHAYEQVRSDLLLAKEILMPGGYVIFDDLLSPHTPGVTAACWEGVANDQLVPVLQTVKMYGTWGDPLPIEVPHGLNAIPHVVNGHVMHHVEGG